MQFYSLKLRLPADIMTCFIDQRSIKIWARSVFPVLETTSPKSISNCLCFSQAHCTRLGCFAFSCFPRTRTYFSSIRIEKYLVSSLATLSCYVVNGFCVVWFSCWALMQSHHTYCVHKTSTPTDSLGTDSNACSFKSKHCNSLMSTHYSLLGLTSKEDVFTRTLVVWESGRRFFLWPRRSFSFMALAARRISFLCSVTSDLMPMVWAMLINHTKNLTGTFCECVIWNEETFERSSSRCMVLDS